MFLARAAAQLHYSPRDALRLTPGEFFDMMAILTPKTHTEEASDPWQLEP